MLNDNLANLCTYSISMCIFSLFLLIRWQLYLLLLVVVTWKNVWANQSFWFDLDSIRSNFCQLSDTWSLWQKTPVTPEPLHNHSMCFLYCLWAWTSTAVSPVRWKKQHPSLCPIQGQLYYKPESCLKISRPVAHHGSVCWLRHSWQPNK